MKNESKSQIEKFDINLNKQINSLEIEMNKIDTEKRKSCLKYY